MSSTPSLDSRISVETYSVSLDSQISVDDYIDSFLCSDLEDHNSRTKEVKDHEDNFSSPTPRCFKRFARRVNHKRLEHLTSECQILIDVSKDCCQSSCLAKLGKKALKDISLWYFSLNGDEQETFLSDRLQLLQESSSRNNVTFEYYINISERCCRKAFKIVLGVGNMWLNRIQCRCLSRDIFVDKQLDVVTGKGLVGQHVVTWMQNYFRLHCDVMPTTGRLHLSDNYTRDELYQIYKEDMQCKGERYIQYNQFTKLWNVRFDNVVIPRNTSEGKDGGVCTLCEPKKYDKGSEI